MANPAKKIEIITIEAPLNGLISEFSPIVNPAEGGEGQYRYAFGTTVKRPGYNGHIAPQEIFDAQIVSDTGTKINTLPRAVAAHVSFPGYNGSATILAGSNTVAPRVILFDNTYTEQTSHDIAHSSSGNFTTLPATGFWGEDCIFYNSQLGTSGVYADAIFYTWNDSVQGNLGVLQYASGISWGDQYVEQNATIAAGSSAYLAPGVPHRMCVGPDKILYITNGQCIASFDGTADQGGANGTFNSYALDLGPGWIAVDIQPYETYIAIAVCQMGSTYTQPSYSKDSRIVLWNGSDLDFSQVYNLNDWCVSSIAVIQDVLYAFTQGLNGTTKVKTLPLNYPSFGTVFELPTSFVGNAPLPNQVEYFNKMIMWASSTFQVFGLSETKDGFAAHPVYYLSDGSHGGVSVGFLKNLNSNILFAGFQSAGGYEIIGVGGDGSSDSIIQSLTTGSYVEFRSAIQDAGYKNNIKGAKAYFSNFGSTSSAYISLIPNRTPYSLDGSNNPNGDILKWTISPSVHPNITKTMTASTSEFSKTLIGVDITQFWVNIRLTNTDKTAPPPIFRKLELYVEPSDNP